MFRMANLVFGSALAFAAVCASAQGPQETFRLPEEALGSQQLIAWSWLQKPQPAPQPLPPKDAPVPQPEPQGQSSIPQSQDAVAQSFTGKIVKDEGKYVLKVASNTSYQLESAGDLAPYENQSVRVVGKLDAAGSTIHVVKIELLS